MLQQTCCFPIKIASEMARYHNLGQINELNETMMLKCTLRTLKKHLPKYYIHVQQYRVKVIGSIDVRL